MRGSDYSYDGDAEAFLLGVEAMRIQTAYQFDPLFAVNSSAVDILPHQIEAVYRYLLPLPKPNGAVVIELPTQSISSITLLTEGQ